LIRKEKDNFESIVFLHGYIIYYASGSIFYVICILKI